MNAEADSAREVFRMFGERYRVLLAGCSDNEDLIMEYHTPAGERLLLTHVLFPTETAMLIIEGIDQQGNVCQVLATAHAVQVMFRVIPKTDHRAGRKPVGFTAKE